MAQRSFYYSPLAEKTLDWLVRYTRAKSANVVFESALHAALDRVLAISGPDSDPPERLPADHALVLEGQALANAWDQLELASRTVDALKMGEKCE